VYLKKPFECKICEDISFTTRSRCYSFILEQHSGVTWKCRFCCRVYHRNPPQANTCHNKKENYIRFVQATGERGEEAGDIMERFKKKQFLI
jgi:hypothetical protein